MIDFEYKNRLKVGGYVFDNLSNIFFITISRDIYLKNFVNYFNLYKSNVEWIRFISKRFKRVSQEYVLPKQFVIV